MAGPAHGRGSPRRYAGWVVRERVNWHKELRLAPGYQSFVISDGGATAYLEPITGSGNYLNTSMPNYQTEFSTWDLSQVSSYSFLNTETGIQENHSISAWSDIPWKPGQVFIVQCKDGNALVINEQGLVLGVNTEGDATQLKQVSEECHDGAKKWSVPDRKSTRLNSSHQD